MPRKRLRPEERRALILDAARRAFTEHGFDGASMRQIASDSGITTPVLYDHFASKEEIYLRVLEEETQALIEATEPLAGRDDPPEQLVAAGVEAFFQFVEERPLTWRLLMHDVPTSPTIAERHRQLQRRGDEAIARMLRPLVLNSPSDAAEDYLDGVAVAVRSAVNGLASWWWEHPKISRQQVTAIATDLLLPGLLALSSRTNGPTERSRPAR